MTTPNTSLFTITAAVTDQDLQDCATVKNTLTPKEPVTLEALKNDVESNPDGLLLIARVGDRPAGSAVCKASSSPQQAFTMLRVLPEWRNKGLGTLFYQAVSEHARKLNRSSLQGRVTETDRAALAFFEKRGFAEVARECPVILNVQDLVVTPAALPDGLEVVALQDREDLYAGAHAVAAEGLPDIPLPEPLTVPALPDWIASEISAPGIRLDGSFVAIADGEVIGYAGIVEISDTAAEHLLTAVKRNWRGQGIASLLKNAQLVWAKQAGLHELITYNHQGNDPIQKLNARLGYQPEPISLVLRGPLCD
ncbi:RimJ/RimL family protein N-acetyltransferase [Tumebacillus sp. BK434]|uniref:GNAT family N-acetyltransferase n=1 Tax=Tumebacillus sp. BK434 TaxID=2512169 RepID=UPI0010DA44C3|nr:GNAT family N-acetyltransferase [Tumebacillus sp. BK434]TCP52179.1 RimJ/RimL family protein N-acetyltransferase [Tumebacillus sp. BK434]